MRCLGPSSSTRSTDCQVPRTSLPLETGIVKDGPSIEPTMWDQACEGLWPRPCAGRVAHVTAFLCSFHAFLITPEHRVLCRASRLEIIHHLVRLTHPFLWRTPANLVERGLQLGL